MAPRTPHGASGTLDSVRDNPVSRVEMKRAKKELAKERKKSKTGDTKTGTVDLTTGDEEEVHSPMKDTLVNLVQGMQDNIVGEMKQTPRGFMISWTAFQRIWRQLKL